MQRFSITALALSLCAACSGHAGLPPSVPPPVAAADGLSERAAIGPAGDHTPDRFERPGLSGDGWILDPEPSDVPEQQLPPSLLDGPDAPVVVEPRLPVAPPGDADAITIAIYVAEAWGNTGPDIVPWHETTRAFLTDGFSESLARDHLAVDQSVASATAVQATSHLTPTGDRVTVTLEQVQASSEIPWRLIIVELLVVDIDGRALVASLEVVA